MEVLFQLSYLSTCTLFPMTAHCVLCSMFLGSIGQAIDSRCILTDFIQDRLPSLSLDHIMNICFYLKGNSKYKATFEILRQSVVYIDLTKDVLQKMLYCAILFMLKRYRDHSDIFKSRT